MKDVLFVLGAKDPEMEVIESILTEEGYDFTIARDDSGHRVLPHTAYEAVWDGEEAGKLVFVECSPSEGRPDGSVVVDHHRPGDPGFDAPPERFWEGSSVGQVARLIGADDLRQDTRIRTIAASDHNLYAAYAGECPGVDPMDVLEIRSESKASFQRKFDPKVTKEDIKNDILQATREIALAKLFYIPGFGEVKDCRDKVIKHLNEAAAFSGETVMYRLPATKKTPLKEGIFSRDPRAIRAWMSHAKERGFSLIWGAPDRGYAGGFPR